MRTPELVDDGDVGKNADEEWTVEVEGSPSRFPGLVKFGIALGGVGLAAVALVFVLPPVLPSSWTKGMAETLIGDVVGMPVAINGSHSVRLLPTTRLSAADIVAVRPAESGLTLKIESVDVEMSTLGLMSASVEVTQATVTKPIVDWRMGEDASAEERTEAIDRAWGWWRDLSIDAFAMTGGEFVVRGRDGRVDYDWQEVSLRTVPPSNGEAQDGLVLDGAATLNGRAVGIRAATSDPKLFVLGNRWPIRLAMESDLFKASFDGSLAMRQQLIGEGRLQLSSADAGALNAWIGPHIPARAGNAMRIGAEVRLDGDALSIENAEIEVGATEAKGMFRLTGFSAGQVRVEGDLKASLLDLSSDDSMTLLFAADRTFGTAMLPPGEINVAWDRILWSSHEFGAGKAILIREDAGARVKLLLTEMACYGGELRGHMTLDASEGLRALDVDASLVGVELGPLAATSSISLTTPFTGQATINLKLFSVGADAPQLTQALVGEAEIVVNDGVLTVPALTAGLLDESRLGIPFQTLTGRFDIGQGIARSEDLLLRAEGLSLVGKGDIDLATGQIDFNVGRLGGTEGHRSLQRFRVSGPTSDIAVEAVNGS